MDDCPTSSIVTTWLACYCTPVRESRAPKPSRTNLQSCMSQGELESASCYRTTNDAASSVVLRGCRQRETDGRLCTTRGPRRCTTHTPHGAQCFCSRGRKHRGLEPICISHTSRAVRRRNRWVNRTVSKGFISPNLDRARDSGRGARPLAYSETPSRFSM